MLKREAIERTMFGMSERETRETIGKLVEELNYAKGKLNHVNEKLRQSQRDWAYLAQDNIFTLLRAEAGKVVVHPGNIQPGNLGARSQATPRSFEGLLSHQELVEILEEKQLWTAKYNDAVQRLWMLAPHLQLMPLS